MLLYHQDQYTPYNRSRFPHYRVGPSEIKSDLVTVHMWSYQEEIKFFDNKWLLKMLHCIKLFALPLEYQWQLSLTWIDEYTSYDATNMTSYIQSFAQVDTMLS